MNRANTFRHMLEYCSLVDLGFNGTKFTWATMCRSSHFVQQILNRVVANSERILKFLEVKVSHLPRTRSDHCPLLLSLSGNSRKRADRPFRLETIWLDRPDFKNLIVQTWNFTMNNHQHATAIFLNRAKEWNKTVFGNIFSRKKKVLATLGATQKIFSINLNTY